MLPEQMFVEINVVGIIRVRTDALRKNVVRINVDRTNAVNRKYVRANAVGKILYSMFSPSKVLKIEVGNHLCPIQ
jgi:hypothetical protein